MGLHISGGVFHWGMGIHIMHHPCVNVKGGGA